MSKQYAEPAAYEAKLEKVMARLGVECYDYNWDRFSCWVEFYYKAQPYKFEHSVDNAQAHGVNIRYGSDVFAQVVLSLEDLARMVERGIYRPVHLGSGDESVTGTVQYTRVLCKARLYRNADN